MARTPSRKRPCRICKRWFLPDPRVKDRQKTCGQPSCQREWHRKKCAKWYKDNPHYFKTNYLQKKIEAVAETKNAERPKSTTPAFRLKSGLPHPFVKEVIGLCHLVIIEYQAQLIHRRCHRLIEGHPAVNSCSICRQPGMTFSRGDPGSTSRKK